MGWLIICFVIWILSVIIIYFSNSDGDKFRQSLASLFFIGIIGGIVQFFAFMIISTEKYHEEFSPLYIESVFMEKNWEVKGTFIIGTGSVSGGSYTNYIVYGKFDKGLKRITLFTYDTYINENSKIPPQIKNYWRKEIAPQWKHWLWFGRKKWQSRYNKNPGDLIMIVPENTIYKSYELK